MADSSKPAQHTQHIQKAWDGPYLKPPKSPKRGVNRHFQAKWHNIETHISRPRFERFRRNLSHWCEWCVTACPGIDIALEGGFDLVGKAGFGVLHASQLIGHAARLLYLRGASLPRAPPPVHPCIRVVCHTPRRSLRSMCGHKIYSIAANHRNLVLSRAQCDVDKARLFAAASPHSGDWLHPPPITAVGLRLSDEAIRVAVARRSGCKACEPHMCACGKAVDARGLHGRSCRRSAPRQQSHSHLNGILWRVIKRAQTPAVEETVSPMHDDNKRPDGMWSSGVARIWCQEGHKS